MTFIQTYSSCSVYFVYSYSGLQMPREVGPSLSVRQVLAAPQVRDPRRLRASHHLRQRLPSSDHLRRRQGPGRDHTHL